MIYSDIFTPFLEESIAFIEISSALKRNSRLFNQTIKIPVKSFLYSYLKTYSFYKSVRLMKIKYYESDFFRKQVLDLIEDYDTNIKLDIDKKILDDINLKINANENLFYLIYNQGFDRLESYSDYEVYSRVLDVFMELLAKTNTSFILKNRLRNLYLEGFIEYMYLKNYEFHIKKNMSVKNNNPTDLKSIFIIFKEKENSPVYLKLDKEELKQYDVIYAKNKDEFVLKPAYKTEFVLLVFYLQKVGKLFECNQNYIPTLSAYNFRDGVKSTRVNNLKHTVNNDFKNEKSIQKKWENIKRYVDNTLL